MLRQLSILLLLLLAAFSVCAQKVDTDNQAIEELLEELSQNEEIDEANLEQMAADLEYYKQNPLNLNTATEEELNQLHIINEFEVNAIRQYIERNGGLTTIYELQLIDKLDQTTIKRILPFIKVEKISQTQAIDQKLLSQALKYGSNQILTRATIQTERADGFAKVSDSVRAQNPNKYYPGNRLKLFTRYSFNYKRKLRFGITAEKDPGEQFFRGHQKKGFDFYSAYLQFNNFGHVETLVVGDYHAKMGQGLIMWSAMSMGKSGMVMDVRKKSSALSGSSSASEYGYFRGIGATLGFGPVKTTAFASRVKLDANVVESDTTNHTEESFTSVQTTGIHATPTQIANQGAVTETSIGANVSVNSSHARLGVSGFAYQFDHPMQPRDGLENKFNFIGTNNYNASVDGQLIFSSLYFFGEAAISKNKGTAVLAGSLMDIAPGLRAAVVYRNYARNYQARYSSAFGENSKTQNEEGFYVGIEATPIKKWKLTMYYDFYRHPWLKVDAHAPSRGHDLLAQADYVASHNTTMNWKFKIETKEVDGTTTNGLKPLTELTKWYLRYNISYNIGQRWNFKNRIEVNSYKKNPTAAEYGYLIYQDINCQPFNAPLSMSFRYAMFNTASYNTRFSTFENDVLYAFSIPMVYGKGTRTYMMLTWKPLANLTLWARAARLWYADKQTIGTSPNQIDTNHKTELKFQISWKF